LPSTCASTNAPLGQGSSLVASNFADATN
jgi:hypothetical protein